MQLTGHNLIGNSNSAAGSQRFRAVNPSSNGFLDTAFHEATDAEVARAAELAEGAFHAYQTLSSATRAQFLDGIADEIEGLGDALITRCMAETALPEARLIAERGRTTQQLRMFADVVREGWWVDARIDTAIPDRSPVPKPDVRQMHIPLGPVGIFGASNFPLAFSVAGGDTASALAAGCPVVVKAHPLHPGTSELVGGAILAAAEKAGMPDGVFSLIHGESYAVGLTLVKHPKITAIGFTGSLKGGKAILDAANQRDVPIPVFAEMGSVNPVFILPGAMRKNKASLARGIAKSMTLGVGQFCTNPGIVVTDQSDGADEFAQMIGEEATSAAPGTMLAVRIRENYMAGIEQLKKDPRVKQAASGSEVFSGNDVPVYVFETDAGNFTGNDHLGREVFGPSTLHVSARGKEEILNVAKALEGQLTATIHGTDEDLEEYSNLVRILERKVGRIIFNGFPTGVEVCHSMVHGGPFPATTAPHTTSVGSAAIRRFARPVCYQSFPQAALPEELQDDNPLGIWRLVNGEWRNGGL